MKNCIIIAGANGKLGREDLTALLPDNIVIGVSRSRMADIVHPHFISISADLTNSGELENAFSEFDPAKYKKITLVHCIGRDKFEHTSYPKIESFETIDPIVYQSNVNTYKYIARILIKKVAAARKTKPVKLKLVQIGSVADKYGLLVIASYSESKNIVRSYMKDAVSLFPWVSALVINISSMDTPSALVIRPYAKTTYWLSVKEVAERSIKEIVSGRSRYKEIAIFKKNPAFKKDYYLDDNAVFRQWSKQVWNI